MSKEKELIKQVLIKQIKKEQTKRYYRLLAFLLLLCIAVLVFYFLVQERPQQISGTSMHASQQIQQQEYKQQTSIDSICNNNKKDLLEKGVDCGGICIKKC